MHFLRSARWSIRSERAMRGLFMGIFTCDQRYHFTRLKKKKNKREAFRLDVTIPVTFMAYFDFMELLCLMKFWYWRNVFFLTVSILAKSVEFVKFRIFPRNIFSVNIYTHHNSFKCDNFGKYADVSFAFLKLALLNYVENLVLDLFQDLCGLA